MVWGGASGSKGLVYLGRQSPEGMQSGELAFKIREAPSEGKGGCTEAGEHLSCGPHAQC